MDDQERTDRTNSDFSGFTAPSNAPGQAESRASKARLDALLNSRRTRPDDGWEVASAEPVAWEDYYYELLAEQVEVEKPDGSKKRVARWDWRKALYIAWHSVPASKRWPKYEVQLIDLLGLTNTRTIRQWKAKDPEIEERIADGPKKLLVGHIADVMEALVTVAKLPDPKAFQDRKLFLEMTKQYTGKLEVTGEDGGPVELEHRVNSEQFAEMMHQAQSLATALTEQAENNWNVGDSKQAQ